MFRIALVIIGIVNSLALSENLNHQVEKRASIGKDLEQEIQDAAAIINRHNRNNIDKDVKFRRNPIIIIVRDPVIPGEKFKKCHGVAIATVSRSGVWEAAMNAGTGLVVGRTSSGKDSPICI